MGTETTADGDDDGVQSVAQLRNNSRQTSVVSVPTTTTTTLVSSISWYTYRPTNDDNVISKISWNLIVDTCFEGMFFLVNF